jgi:para-nitrobenzyl esterase
MVVSTFAGLLCFNMAAAERVRTDVGTVEGIRSAKGIRIFKGIPFGAPPVGDLRWKGPKPVAKWNGVRKALEFGPRCMQTRVYSDMIFRDNGPSEDCLTLNVWTPAKSGKDKLPVMVWIFGGGFMAGGTSEPRQDGENLAKRGVVVVSMNYRLGVFGFLAHPELTKESDRGASGNYGLMDQGAALDWVHRNIARFGGDPGNVTIFGESAGSFSVSAQMASPLSRGLLHRAIGESGAMFSSTLAARSLEQSEANGVKFAESIGVSTLAELRARPANELLEAAAKQREIRFSPNIDGYFLPDTPLAIFTAGKQAQVPLLAGWNEDEGNVQGYFGDLEPTVQNYAERARSLFGEDADRFVKLYPGSTAEEVKDSARDFAGDQFIAYSTWKWLDVHARTGKSPVWRYRFDQVPPATPSRGAYHSAEIEFVFGVLASKELPWTPGDHKVSETMMGYWTNFAKKGDPNGPGLPEWPQYEAGSGWRYLHFTAEPYVTPDKERERYEFLDTHKPMIPRRN